MTDVRTVTVEELQALKDIQAEYNALTIKYGQLHFQKLEIEAEQASVEYRFAEIREVQKKIMNDLNEKYGTGKPLSLNLDTGIIG